MKGSPGKTGHISRGFEKSSTGDCSVLLCWLSSIFFPVYWGMRQYRRDTADAASARDVAAADRATIDTVTMEIRE